MQERVEVAARRRELSASCEVLAKAVAELQLLPRELEARAGLGPRSRTGSQVGGLLDGSEVPTGTSPSAARVASRSLEMYHSLNSSQALHMSNAGL